MLHCLSIYLLINNGLTEVGNTSPFTESMCITQWSITLEINLLRAERGRELVQENRGNKDKIKEKWQEMISKATVPYILHHFIYFLCGSSFPESPNEKFFG